MIDALALSQAAADAAQYGDFPWIGSRGAVWIAAQLHPQQGAHDSLRNAVTTPEDLGFDLAYNRDH